jgi:acyl-CoA reductase-like NAD-dependent aldehyde dehydrogenase
MLEVRSPYDQSLIKKIPLVGKQEVEKALTTAYALFQDQSKWIPAYERIAILERTAAIMNTRMEELIKIAAQEGGKPYVDSKAEVIRAIDGVKIAAAHISQLKGEQIPMSLTKHLKTELLLQQENP